MKGSDTEIVLAERLGASARALEALARDGQQRATLAAIVEALARALGRGGKILICGNGGSAADAQHLATELVVRLRASCERRALAAIALTTDTSLLTACANDYGFERVFARQIEALGREGDVLVGISTSGNSANVVAAFEQARAQRLVTVLFSGGDGGRLLQLADHALIVPSRDTAHIQEGHLACYHALCHALEARMFPTEAGRAS